MRKEELMSRSDALAKAFVLAIATGSLVLGGCYKLCPAPDVEPLLLAVDPSLGAESDGNGVLEPGETAVIEPSWQNRGRSVTVLKSRPCPANPTPNETGIASAWNGPFGATYTIRDAAAKYGFIPRGSSSSCATQGDCYALVVSVPALRPVHHWDSSFTETLSGTQLRSQLWSLHVGDSFEDVPRSNPFYKAIETLFHNGITEGCTDNGFCPGDAATRSELMMFTARASFGGDGNVPVSGSVSGQPYDCRDGGLSIFTDVSPTDPFCRHVHAIAAKNVEVACGDSRFCPSDGMPRAQEAILLAQILVAPPPADNDSTVPLAYGPDPATGRAYSCDPSSPSLHFADVGTLDPFCRHAHFLWAKGVLEGCSADRFCASDEVARDEIAAHVVNAFGLRLDAPAREIPRAASFYTVEPCRAVDTREGEPLDPGAERTFVLAGRCGIPASARAVSLNVTVTGSTAAGSVSLFPAGTRASGVSVVDYGAGQTRANNAVLGLAGGAIGAHCDQCDQELGTVQLVIDVNGYFE
jgi:hypothetical protein